MCFQNTFNAFSKAKMHSMHSQNMLNVFVKPTHLHTMSNWVYGALWGFCYNHTSNTTFSIIVLLFIMYAPNYSFAVVHHHECMSACMQNKWWDKKCTRNLILGTPSGPKYSQHFCCWLIGKCDPHRIHGFCTRVRLEISESHSIDE